THALQQAKHVLAWGYQRREQPDPLGGQDRQLGQQAQGGAVDVLGLGQVDDDRAEVQRADNLLDVGVQRCAERQPHITENREDKGSVGLGKLNPARGHHCCFLLNINTEISSGITRGSSSPSNCMKRGRSPQACSTREGRRSSFSFKVVPSTQSSTPSEHRVRVKVSGSGISWFSYSASSNSPTGLPLPCR